MLDHPGSVTPMPGESRALVEAWITTLGLLAGLVGPPLLVIAADFWAPLAGFTGWAWTAGMASGLLMIAAGLFYLARWARQTRRLARQRLALELLNIDEDERHRVYIHLRRARTSNSLAVENLAEIRPQFIALQELAAEGALTPAEFRLRTRQLNAPHAQISTSRSTRNQELRALRLRRRAGLISEAEFNRSVAGLSRESLGEAQQAAPGLHSAAVLISLGALVILPAAVSALARGAEALEPFFIGLYFSTPALLMWVFFEIQRLLPYRTARPQGAAQWLDAASSAAQILSAFGLWNFFGLAYTTGEVVWLLGVSAGLALIGALCATAGAVLERRVEGAVPEGAHAGQTPTTGDMPAGGGVPVGGNSADEIPAPVPAPERDTSAPVSPGPQEITETSPAEPDMRASQEQPREAAPAETGAAAPSQARAGEFEIFRGRSGEYYFRLRAANGEIILRSEGYTSLTGCRNGVRSVKANAPLEKRYDTRTAANGEPYFVLKAGNHQVIGVSETYSSPQACARGILAVQRVAAHAPVTETL